MLTPFTPQILREEHRFNRFEPHYFTFGAFFLTGSFGSFLSKTNNSNNDPEVSTWVQILGQAREHVRGSLSSTFLPLVLTV